MSLVRLLTTGKSLVGLGEPTVRYRMRNRFLLRPPPLGSSGRQQRGLRSARRWFDIEPLEVRVDRAGSDRIRRPPLGLNVRSVMRPSARTSTSGERENEIDERDEK